MAGCLLSLPPRASAQLVLLGAQSQPGDTGGLLTESWSQGELAKIAMLRQHPSTKLLPMVGGIPSFLCPEGKLPPHLSRCSDTNECVLREQLCNGVYECRDRSDETYCYGRDVPCTTVAGGHTGRPHLPVQVQWLRVPELHTGRCGGDVDAGWRRPVRARLHTEPRHKRRLLAAMPGRVRTRGRLLVRLLLRRLLRRLHFVMLERTPPRDHQLHDVPLQR